MTENSLEHQIMSTKPIAMRRCLWLVNEATFGVTKPDMAVTFTLRAISNYAHFGRQFKSREIKERNRLVTVCALKMLEKLNFDFDCWHNKTENEHPISLSAIWYELCERAQSANDFEALAEWLYEIISSSKMVTVLKTEHIKLKNHTLDWQNRYEKAGICLVTLLQSPSELCKKASS